MSRVRVPSLTPDEGPRKRKEEKRIGDDRRGGSMTIARPTALTATSISTARLTAATLAGRAAGAASRLARRGSGASIRGKVMLKIDPDSLAKLLAGKRIAVVSGTNGKTTTTHFLAAALRASLGSEADGLVHNADGANLHHGLASALSQQPKAAILESDERVVGDMIRIGRPEVLVL